MAASDTKKTKTNGKKVIKPMKSIHIVVYSCTNCGEELEELKLCNECNSPMKVVQVIEKYGQEAEEYLADLKRDGEWDADAVKPKKEEEEEDDGIEGDDLDGLDIPIHGVDDKVKDDTDEVGLTDIFPDADGTVKAKGVSDMDFMETLDKLDEEEDMDDIDGLGPEGLPEL